VTDRTDAELIDAADSEAGPFGELYRRHVSTVHAWFRRRLEWVEVDGRDAIKLESLDGKKTYIVDASTYDPIEWTTKGTDGGVTLRFSVYEELPVDSQSMSLLDLQAQHPSAQVDRDVRAYMAAESRLYPHG
jgi:hypothetical protein